MAYSKPGRERLLTRATARKKAARRRKDDVASSWGARPSGRAATGQTWIESRLEYAGPRSLGARPGSAARSIRRCGPFHSAGFGGALRAEACSTFSRCFDTVARLGLDAKRATAPGRTLA